MVDKTDNAHNDEVALSATEASLYRREAGEKEEESARGTMEREKREEGPCHIMCGSLAGFVACLWFWLNQATIWTLLKGVVKMIV